MKEYTRFFCELASFLTNFASKVAMFVLVVAMFVLVGCKSKEYVTIDHIRTDSTFRQVTDTVTVRMRVADYSYTLPSVLLERETRDTLSVLQDSLYRSVASVSNGVLYHSLATIQGARLNVPVQTSDTARTNRQYIYINRTDSVYVPTPVERELTWWEKMRLNLFYPFAAVMVAVVCYIIVWLVRRFR